MMLVGSVNTFVPAPFARDGKVRSYRTKTSTPTRLATAVPVMPETMY